MTVLTGGLLLTAFLTSWATVGLVRRYALARSILDRPNERSSHTVPTPRGGGLGIVVPFVLLWAAYLTARGGVDDAAPALGTALALVAAAGVAAVGWWDDRGHVPVRVRLTCHLLAGSLLLPLALTPSPVPAWMGIGAAAWWVFWTVSAINVVNFMDGIDGLIGSQMLILGVHLALLGGVVATPGGSAVAWGLVLAGVCGGFLIWNRAPARIFMGDVGSGSLGVLAVAGGLLLMRERGTGLIPAFLPLYPLFLDATTTLLRRLRAGERVWEAHRSHLYQRLANGGWGHGKVTVLYAVAALAALPVTHLPTQEMRLVGTGAYAALILAIGLRLHRSAVVERGGGPE